jgi:hypothetical protein
MRASLLTSVAALIVAAGSPAGSTTSSHDAQRGAPEVQSMSRLAFAPDGVLLVGDSSAAAVWAIDLGDRTPNGARQELKVDDIDGKIAALLGTTRDEILVHDMAVNPLSQNVYLSVSRGLQQTHRLLPVPNDAADARILLKVSPAGEISEVPLKDVAWSRAGIPNPPAPEAKLWEFKSRSFTVTDLAYDDGKVYVAGLSNEQFASTFRVLPYPFGGEQSVTTLEVYHAAHGKYETESPIETFLPYRLKGRPHLLASYTCTPLAVFPMEALKDRAHVKGTTVAEFGSGNMPLDMVAYENKGKPYILLANSSRAVMRIDPADVERHTAGLTEPVDRWATAGIPFLALPVVGVQQLDRLNDGYLLLLRRSLRDGSLGLTSVSVDIL